MERYEINPELKCIKLDKESREKLEKLKPIDMDVALKRLDRAGYKATYKGIDLDGMPHYKIEKRQ